MRSGFCWAGLSCLVACGSARLQSSHQLAPGAAVDAGAVDTGAVDTGAVDAGAGAEDAQAADAGPARCKRGIASNAAPSPSLAAGDAGPGVTWWYNWSNQGAGAAPGIEFVPMIWGSANLNGPIASTSRYLLGFNEPNFVAQSDLTPQQAADDWPSVEALAAAAGVPLVSPGVNFCGSSTDTSGCSDPSVTDPYTWLEDFFAACTGCRVDYIAVHWYNCDLPSLQGYLEGNADAGGGLQGFVQFGKPIWLTEFSCDATHSVADQQAYMQAAVPYLEADPNVFRYSWFSASAIPNAVLMNADGSLTDLGKIYVSLPGSCP